jgi:hypothetical protein
MPSQVGVTGEGRKGVMDDLTRHQQQYSEGGAEQTTQRLDIECSFLSFPYLHYIAENVENHVHDRTPYVRKANQ